MAYQISPGVEIVETDLSQYISPQSPSIGAYAGHFAWGPVGGVDGSVTTVSNERELRKYYGNPTSGYERSFFTASGFLQYSDNLNISRAVEIPARANETDPAEAFATNLSFAGTTNAYWFSGTDDGVTEWNGAAPGDEIPRHQISLQEELEAYGNSDAIYARYPGARANGLKVYLIQGPQYDSLDATLQSALGYKPDSTSWATRTAGADGTTQGLDEVHVIIVDSAGEFGEADEILEVHIGLSAASNGLDSYGESNFYRNVINKRSEYIWLSVTSDESDLTSNNVSGWTAGTLVTAVTPYELAYGVDRSLDAANVNEFYGVLASQPSVYPENVQTALKAFEDEEQININLLFAEQAGGEALGENIDINSAIDDEIQTIVENRKDAVGFISAPLSVSLLPNAEQKKNEVLNKFNAIGSSSYLVFDNSPGLVYNRDTDRFVWIPLSGHIAGLCARTDITNDPWFSPAGFNRGNLSPKVVRLAYSPNKTHRDQLYSKRINPVISYPGQGIILYGDKTGQSKPSAFDRINVRRLFITIEKAIANFAKFSLFEQNDEFTRAAFVNTVNPFLSDVQGRRGIEAFRVVCDESNNTPEVIDRNEMVATIYINPTRSINFITLNFVATRTGASFTELTSG